MTGKRIFILWIAFVIYFFNYSLVRSSDSSTENDPVIVKREMTTNGLQADLFFLNNAQNQKGLLLLGGSEGGKPASQVNDQIEDLVTSGYAVLSLAYFNYEGLPPTLQRIPLEYFDQAIEILQSQPEVQETGIAVVGGSKGGELALLLASHNPAVETVVAISPCAYVLEGIGGPQGIEEIVSSWSVQDADIPFLPYCSSMETWQQAYRTGDFLTVHQEALAQKAEYPSAAIKVEDIQGSILLVSGKQDNMWPSEEMCEEIIKRLESNNFPYQLKHLSYDVGHNVVDEAETCFSEIISFLKSATINPHME